MATVGVNAPVRGTMKPSQKKTSPSIAEAARAAGRPAARLTARRAPRRPSRPSRRSRWSAASTTPTSTSAIPANCRALGRSRRKSTARTTVKAL